MKKNIVFLIVFAVILLVGLCLPFYYFRGGLIGAAEDEVLHITFSFFANNWLKFILLITGSTGIIIFLIRLIKKRP